MRSLDSVTFDAAGFALQGDRNGVRVWHTPTGDWLGLYYFPAPPDFQADIGSIQELRSFYRQAALRSGGAIIGSTGSTLTLAPRYGQSSKFRSIPLV